ncbi:MAG: DUF1150 family protein, partial [Alphaproteobacteria bacterium]|nr:DUF1150 family protein [Alphaproteobacteria bacterium]
MNAAFDFGPENGDAIVYVRPVDVADLPEPIRAQIGGAGVIYAVHRADGERL